MKTKSTMIHDALILCVITLCCGLLVAFFHELTAGPIAANEQAQKQKAYQSIFAEGESFDAEPAVLSGEEAGTYGQQILAESDRSYGNMTVDEIVEVKDAGGSFVGYIVSVTSGDGYGGDISISVGVDAKGSISGVEILSISETAGLGMKAKEESFRSQYTGKNVEAFTVTKMGAVSDDEIDALSGATITSRAMTNSVNAALAVANALLEGGAD